MQLERNRGVRVQPPGSAIGSFAVENLVPCHLDSPTLRFPIGRSNAFEKGSKCVGVRSLGELLLRVRRNIANWVARPTAEERRGTKDGEAAGTSEAPPLMLMGWSMTAMPSCELRVAFSLPRVAEKCAVCALRATERAGVSLARADGNRHEQANANDCADHPATNLDDTSLPHWALGVAERPGSPTRRRWRPP